MRAAVEEERCRTIEAMKEAAQVHPLANEPGSEAG